MIVPVLSAVAHLASQFAHRYFPIAREGLSGAFQDRFSNLFTMSPDDWLKAIEQVATDPAFRLHNALRAYLGTCDQRGLADVISNHFEYLQRANGFYLGIEDPLYPPLLRTLPDPPTGLSGLGNSTILGEPMYAVIGSRRATSRALSESFELGQQLACAGFVVLSGGAFGCDIAAHLGVLARKGTVPAVVVMAGGLSELYPKNNGAAFRQIIARGGAIISERLWSQRPKPYDFPVRNRIISGLAHEVFVMQAGIKSGAMITARLALDQGREVRVMSHPETHLGAMGTWQLIRDGAPVFLSASHLMDGLRDVY